MATSPLKPQITLYCVRLAKNSCLGYVRQGQLNIYNLKATQQNNRSVQLCRFMTTKISIAASILFCTISFMSLFIVSKP